MTIVLSVQCKMSGQKEELTKVKDANRVLEKANEKYAVKVTNLQKRLEKAQADAEYNKNEMKAKCGFDTLEKAYKRDIDRLKLTIEQLEKELQDKEYLIAAKHRASKKKDADLKQYKLDLEDFEATKSENISLNQSILQNTEVRDAKRKLEADRLRIQRVADEKVRRLEEELGAKQERIERLERAARQKEEEEEDGDEDADGMDD
jgi:hypothetical protein